MRENAYFTSTQVEEERSLEGLSKVNEFRSGDFLQCFLAIPLIRYIIICLGRLAH